MAAGRRSPLAGAPKWLVGAAFFELIVGCGKVLHGDWFGVAVDGFGFCACLTAAALTVHNRVMEAEHQARLKALREDTHGLR